MRKWHHPWLLRKVPILFIKMKPRKARNDCQCKTILIFLAFSCFPSTEKPGSPLVFALIFNILQQYVKQNNSKWSTNMLYFNLPFVYMCKYCWKRGKHWKNVNRNSAIMLIFFFVGLHSCCLGNFQFFPTLKPIQLNLIKL